MKKVEKVNKKGIEQYYCLDLAKLQNSPTNFTFSLFYLQLLTFSAACHRTQRPASPNACKQNRRGIGVMSRRILSVEN
jgi:hypothetical protein